ncbi:uncharacterized protein LOC134764353 [Penaeus indicus]|uniref:uncharacterized protein LOC134764353 n=1 Tax=Penaeus indicus TaxID=29960 RepID=UPI00300D1BD7
MIQGDHHTLALGTLASFEVKFDKSFGVANKHGRGGQSQNRFARLADESRLNHLKAVYERMERAFLAEDKRIVVAGPGPMKSQFVEHLPRFWSSLVDQQLVTTTVVGASGLQQLLGQLKEQCSKSSGAEKQRLRTFRIQSDMQRKMGSEEKCKKCDLIEELRMRSGVTCNRIFIGATLLKRATSTRRPLISDALPCFFDLSSPAAFTLRLLYRLVFAPKAFDLYSAPAMVL